MRHSRVLKGLIGCVLLICVCEKEQLQEVKKTEQPQIDVPSPQWDAVLTWQSSAADTAKGSENSGFYNQLIAEQLSGYMSRLGHIKVIPDEEGASAVSDSGHYTGSSVVTWVDEDTLKISYAVEEMKSGLQLFEETQKVSLQDLMLEQWHPDEGLAAALNAPPQNPLPAKDFSVDAAVLNGYRQGMLYLSAGTRADIDQAIVTFKEVLREDSTFVRAWIGLSESYLMIQENQWQPHIVWPRLALETARKAHALNDTLEGGLICLGRSLFLFGDFQQAESCFRRVLDQNQNAVDAWKGMARIYQHFYLYDACLKTAETVLALRPADQDARMMQSMIVMMHGDYVQAEQILTESRQNRITHSLRALSAFYQNQHEKALRVLDFPEADPFAGAVEAMIHVKQNNLDDALALVELEVKPHAYGQASLEMAVAAVYNLLGRKTLAVQWVNQAAESGYEDYEWLLNDPNFKSLSKDTAYVEVLEKIKQAWQVKRAAYHGLSGH